MAKETKVPEPLASATQATQRACKVPLNELRLLPGQFRHRKEGEITDEEQGAFRDSIISEGGVRVPLVFFTNDQGVKIVVSGHRRHAMCNDLAKENQAGFTEDMLIDAVELQNASPADLLIWSIADNQNRKSLSPNSRLELVSKLYDAGIDNRRAAAALGIGPSTYDRALTIIKHQWLWDHVKKRAITPSNAALLMGHAVKHERVQEFQEDLEAWIARKAKELEEAAAANKAATGKDPAARDLEVLHKMEAHLIKHWEKCIEAGQRLSDGGEWDFHATIEKNLFKVDAVSFDINTVTAEKAAKVLAGLSMAAKKLRPVVIERTVVERSRQAEDEARQSPLYDFGVLRELGMDALADHLEEKALTPASAEGDGVDDDGPEPEPVREEKDLASSLELPKPALPRGAANLDSRSASGGGRVRKEPTLPDGPGGLDVRKV